MTNASQALLEMRGTLKSIQDSEDFDPNYVFPSASTSGGWVGMGKLKLNYLFITPTTTLTATKPTTTP